MDDGPKFNMNDFFNDKGILYQTSCVETPHDVLWRENINIFSLGRALMFQSSIPKVFWSYAISHAIYLTNKFPSVKLLNHSPYELLYNKKPDFSHLRVFGCLMYAYTLLRHRGKLDSR
jgi:hypothetical protein